MKYLKELTLSALTLSISTTYAAELVKLNLATSEALLKNKGFVATQQLALVKDYGKHQRMNQTIHGIPVYGHQVIRHSGNTYTGHFIKTTPKEHSLLAVKPSFTANDALEIAKSDFNTNKSIKRYSYQNELSQLNYYLDGKKLRLTYIVSFFADTTPEGEPARPFYIIDAMSKEIIAKHDALTTDAIGAGPGGNEKVGRYEYGKDFPNLDVKVLEDKETCAMTNVNIKTVNLDHEYGGSDTFEYTCPYHDADDEINGGFSAINDAHFFGGVIFNMYKDWYNTAPLSFQLMLRVHYGDEYENAFWNGSSMTFGDGHYYFYPLVALDVVAHEVSHGVTEQNSNLEYWGQSGGLNESFSDMAGKLAEYFMRGSNTWGIGEDIIKSDMPLRYMDTPEKDGRSISDARDYDSGIDVHFSSGVFNKFFYTLATTPGWTTRTAFDVMIDANRHYWERSTNFAEAAEGAIAAAIDLNYKVEDIVHAANAVGLTCDKDYHAGWECRISDPDEDHPKRDDDDE